MIRPTHVSSNQLSFDEVIAARAADARSAPLVMDRLLTPREVAELLRIPKSTVYELARTRRIPHLKVGRRILFEEKTLTEWVASRLIPPES